MFTISVGTNARVHGICCIAVGDNTFARGAYQISIGEKITIPNDLTKAMAIATLHEIKELKLTFQAMCDQRVAPAEFGPNSAKAIDFLAAAIEKHFGKNLEELIEDVKKEDPKNNISSSTLENEKEKK